MATSSKSFGARLPVGYEVPLRVVSSLTHRELRYTRQAQEEVLEDAYPVKLFSGADLVRFLRELKLVAGDHLREDWLAVALNR